MFLYSQSSGERPAATYVETNALVASRTTGLLVKTYESLTGDLTAKPLLTQGLRPDGVLFIDEATKTRAITNLGRPGQLADSVVDGEGCVVVKGAFLADTNMVEDGDYAHGTPLTCSANGKLEKATSGDVVFAEVRGGATVASGNRSISVWFFLDNPRTL